MLLCSAPPGMYTEAYQQVGQSVNMAISCGMHQIQSSMWRPASGPDELEQFLPYPFDNVDLGERIHTFWQVRPFSHGIGAPLAHIHSRLYPSIDSWQWSSDNHRT